MRWGVPCSYRMTLLSIVCKPGWRPMLIVLLRWWRRSSRVRRLLIVEEGEDDAETHFPSSGPSWGGSHDGAAVAGIDGRLWRGSQSHFPETFRCHLHGQWRERG